MEVQRGEIRLEKLVKSFGGGVVAVDGIDLFMPPGSSSPWSARPAAARRRRCA